MPRSNPYSPSFNAGELSPRLHARTDFSKYSRGLEICENLIPLSEGGAMRRAGSRFVAPVADSVRRSKLKKFEFSTTQAYMLELGHETIRFFRHQAQIAAEATDAVVVNGTFDTDISGWTNSSSGGSISHDATTGRLRLRPTSTPNTAVATQSIATTSIGVEHVLKFTIGGVAGDAVTVRVGSAVGLDEYFEAAFRYTGYHAIAFTPTASPFVIQFSATLDGTDNSGGKTIYLDDVSIINDNAVSIDSPYQEEDLQATTSRLGVDGPQSADVLYLFHADYPTHKVERYGHSTWSLTEVDWIDGPWLSENDTDTTLNVSVATSGYQVLINASSIIGINDDTGFQSTDVGRLVRISNPATGIDWGYLKITSVNSPTQCRADVRRDVAQLTTNTTAWRLGSWSGTTGYPQCGGFYEQRLFAANTEEQAQTVWATQTADFENMSPDSPAETGEWDGTVEDDDALEYTLSSDEVDSIFWLSPGEDTLAIGTSGGVWVPISQGPVLTPTDVVIRKQVSHKAAPIPPLRIGAVVLFVQRAKRKIREFGFAFEIDGYRAPDMTRLAQHITASADRRGISEMAYAEEPDSLVWAVRSDGQLLSMTYRREEDVVGWSRHIFGGAFGEGDAVVESVAVIPGADGDGQVQSSEDRDEVWVIVKRTIDGQTQRYIEVLERDYATGEPQEDAYYSDSIITYDGAPATVITGLDHLEGETVKVLADGAIVTDKTVAFGQITLTEEASVVQIGLGFTHRLKSLKVEGGTQAGTAVGKTKRIHGLTLVLLDSATFMVGPDEDHLEEREFRIVSDEVDAAVPLFTGEHFLEFDGDWTTDSRMVIVSEQPISFNLLALAPELAINEVR